jgi:hypothetical protein
MSSFDAEKSRIRGALPADIPCAERDAGGGKILECNSPGDGLRLGVVSELRGPGSLEVSIVWDRSASDGQSTYAAFRKAADAYGFSEADEQVCRNDGRYSEQADSLSVICTGSETAYMLVITSQKRV